MSRALAALLCILLMFPASVFANETPPTSQPDSGLSLGSFTLLQENQPAPYAGFLFDRQGVSKLLTETEFAVRELRLRHNFELDKGNALWQLKLDNALAANTSLQERQDSLIKIKDDEILRLQEISLDKPNDYSVWWFAGGVVAGIFVSIGVFYAAAEGFKDQ
jgi:hypothetical protein